MTMFPRGVCIIFRTKLFKYEFIFILNTIFSCCTFKSHALLETVLSAFILNHMTKDKKSTQYSGSMLHSFKFGISNNFFVNQQSVTIYNMYVWKMKTMKSVSLNENKNTYHLSLLQQCFTLKHLVMSGRYCAVQTSHHHKHP